jgi:sterol desaturase/sphingolipid hydroxylase (fatty acid hydroxylase superfamily)
MSTSVADMPVIEKPSGFKRLLGMAIFPGVLLAGLLGVRTGMEAGYNPSLVFVIGSLLWVSTIAIAERYIPYRTDWNTNRGDLLTDTLHFFLSSWACTELVKVGLIALLIPAASRLAEVAGFGLWPADWNIWAQLALAAVIIEFGGYWVHRVCHETDFFWRFHSTHHSAERLYWLNAGRDHPLGASLTTIGQMAPVIILGVSEECMVLYLVLQSIHGLFQHANINVKLGPLNWLFSMAELHRWHHSLKLEEANTNYGLTLIVWDVVFGSRYLPDSPGPCNIGIESMPNFPRGYWQQLTIPFRWKFWKKATR